MQAGKKGYELGRRYRQPEKIAVYPIVLSGDRTVESGSRLRTGRGNGSRRAAGRIARCGQAHPRPMYAGERIRARMANKEKRETDEY